METGDEEEDIFIPEKETGTALHGDHVQVLLEKEEKAGKRREGTVVKILEREPGRSSEPFRERMIMDLSSATTRNFSETYIFLQKIPRESGTGKRLWRRSLIMDRKSASRREGSRKSLEISILPEQISWRL